MSPLSAVLTGQVSAVILSSLLLPGSQPDGGTLYLAEQRVLGTDILVEAVIVNLLKREQRRVEHLARNPLGTLSVLELDNGQYLRSLCPSLPSTRLPLP